MRSVRTVPLLLAVAAGLHLAALPSHVGEGPLVGAFFVVVAAAQLTAAVLVHRGAGPMARAVIAAGNLGVLAVWLVSRTAGLAVGGHAGGPEPVSILDGLATGFGLAAVVGLYLFGTTSRPASPRRLAGLPALAVVASLATLAGLPLAAPAHSHDPAPVSRPASHADGHAHQH